MAMLSAVVVVTGGLALALGAARLILGGLLSLVFGRGST